MTAVANVTYSADWIEACRDYRGRLLSGRFAHWCPAWDGLPVDETCREWPCSCAAELQAAARRVDPPPTLLED